MAKRLTAVNITNLDKLEGLDWTERRGSHQWLEIGRIYVDKWDNSLTTMLAKVCRVLKCTWWFPWITRRIYRDFYVGLALRVERTGGIRRCLITGYVIQLECKTSGFRLFSHLQHEQQHSLTIPIACQWLSSSNWRSHPFIISVQLADPILTNLPLIKSSARMCVGVADEPHNQISHSVPKLALRFEKRQGVRQDKPKKSKQRWP